MDEQKSKLTATEIIELRKKRAAVVSRELEADILLFNGPIVRPFDAMLHTKCSGRKRAKNILLILVTEGGDADAAYRISRALQEHYEKFLCLIPGYCKSAGTLIAVGAHEMIFGGIGELGPLDVQMSKRDDLIEMQSGQTVVSALSSLQEKAFGAFQQFFVEMQMNSGGRITLRTAADLACQLTIGLLSPIYRQIDPMHVGEAGRASSIAQQYGMRLNEVGRNLRKDALDFLIGGYSNHGFVIDRREATKLFQRVREATPSEADLIESLGDASYKPISQVPGRIDFLTDRNINNQKDKSNVKPTGPRSTPTSKTRKAPASSGRSSPANGSDARGLLT